MVAGNVVPDPMSTLLWAWSLAGQEQLGWNAHGKPRPCLLKRPGYLILDYSISPQWSECNHRSLVRNKWNYSCSYSGRNANAKAAKEGNTSPIFDYNIKSGAYFASHSRPPKYWAAWMTKRQIKNRRLYKDRWLGALLHGFLHVRFHPPQLLSSRRSTFTCQQCTNKMHVSICINCLPNHTLLSYLCIDQQSISSS